MGDEIITHCSAAGGLRCFDYLLMQCLLLFLVGIGHWGPGF